MNTPPPESEFPKPEPLPSLSTPVPHLAQVDASPSPNYRRRRHTITRPDPAVELLPDCDDNEHDDQALDRISGILSTLLQEANEAVQNNGTKSLSHRKSNPLSRPRPHSALLRSSTTTAPNYNTPSSRHKSIQSLSRLPRPTHSSQYWQTHDRHSSLSSSASSTSLFSPAPTTAESPITASSVDQQSTYFLDRQQNYDIIPMSPTNMLKQSSSPSSFESICYSGTDTNDETQQAHDDQDTQPIKPASATTTTPPHTLTRFDDPLMESFRRLDSSMAMVDSLSRDLAQQQQQQHYDEDGEMESSTAHHYRPRLNSFISSTSTSKLTLLFLPLLHIPHALITTMFDTLMSSPGNNQPTTTWPSSSSSSFVNASASLSGIVAWTICFALANIVVTWSGAPSPYRFLTQQRSFSADIVRPRRLSLPGSYQPSIDNNNNNNNNNWTFEKEYSHRMERSRRPTPINTTVCTKKPATYHSVRRTPIKHSTPYSSSSSSSARKRISGHQHRPPPSSTSMALSQSNDRSYALAIQQSRAWKTQQQQQQQQQIPDGWEWMDGADSQPHFAVIRRRYSF